MKSKILIASDSKARRISHKESFVKLRPESDFILVKSFQQALEQINKEKYSLIVLDQNVEDLKRRKRSESIKELKDKSGNAPVVVIGSEINQALASIMDGADGFIPLNWFFSE